MKEYYGVLSAKNGHQSIRPVKKIFEDNKSKTKNIFIDSKSFTFLCELMGEGKFSAPKKREIKNGCILLSELMGIYVYIHSECISYISFINNNDSEFIRVYLDSKGEVREKRFKKLLDK